MDRERAARLALGAGIVVLVLKSAAWWTTGSVAILSDALESVVNVVAAVLLVGTVGCTGDNTSKTEAPKTEAPKTETATTPPTEAPRSKVPSKPMTEPWRAASAHILIAFDGAEGDL